MLILGDDTNLIKLDELKAHIDQSNKKMISKKLIC
jgi:hypothetical protein